MDVGSFLIGVAVSAFAAVVAAVVIDRHRKHGANYIAVRDKYFEEMKVVHQDDDEYFRFAALQRAGACLLSSGQLKDLGNEIKGRTGSDPFGAWKPVFGAERDFPKCAFAWAQKYGVDFSKPEAALLKMAEQYDTKQAPKGPSGPGIFLI